MRIDFSGRTVLVTGATRGIGAQIASDMGGMGARLILTGTDPERIRALNEGVDEGKCRYLAADFSVDQELSCFLDEISKEDRIDVLVNNAGINRINRIDDSLASDWDAISAVNLRAPVLITRSVSRLMRRQGYGRIVNIGSIFGVVSKPERAFYSATKFGLHGLTVASALDLATSGVLVNTVSPGFVSTDLTREILGKDQMQQLAQDVPLLRFAEPVEVSRVVAFLASDLNSYITGQNIIVDGGFVSA